MGKDVEDIQGQEEVESKEEKHEETDDVSCLPCDPVAGENVDMEVEQEAKAQIPVTDPVQPTQAMIVEHELSHSPFGPWCSACVCGRAKDAPSRKVKGRFAEHVLPRVRMDYCYLTEDVEQQEGEHGEAEATNAGASVTVAVLQ